MWQIIKDEIIRDVTGLLCLLGVLLLITAPGWLGLGLLYALKIFCKILDIGG